MATTVQGLEFRVRSDSTQQTGCRASESQPTSLSAEVGY